MFGGRRFSSFLPSKESVSDGAPLIAALLAPAATLFDIPALSQRWYSFDGAQISDPTASLVLSAVSLAFSIVANVLLVVRFTIHNPRRWRAAIFISTLGWVLKTAVGFSNLIVFGATRRNGAGYRYLEGFWCAILSVILSGIVTILLTAHYLTNVRDRPEGSVNLDCRLLIISEMILFAVMALEALIFSRVEQWSYLDGLYFSVVSLLTIGFGNFAPTQTSTKILLFPFSILGIALLSNQVTLITSVSARLTASYRKTLNYGPKLHRRLTRQLTYLGGKVDGLRGGKSTIAIVEEETCSNDSDHELLREVKRLKRLHALHEGADEMFAFLFSLLLLVLFWFVSGAIFQAIEGWTFGDAMYFSYIFFLTIGYGDFAPNTPAGKTVFVFWAMLAVPVMTNFVVQTIQTIVSRSSTLLSNRARERRTQWIEYVATYFVPHSDLVDQVRRDIDNETSKEQDKEDEEERQARSYESPKKEKSIEKDDRVLGGGGGDEKRKGQQEDDADEMVTVSKTMLMAALEQSVKLEAECRDMLLDQLKTGTAPWLLLKADSNVNKTRGMENRMRYGRRQGQNGDGTHSTTSSIYEEFGELSKEDVIDRVGHYRQTYAKFLVLAGRLVDMDGRELFEWESKVEIQARKIVEGSSSDSDT